MKSTFYALLITAAVTSLCSCSKDRITGSGNVKTEDRQLTGFTKVSTQGSTNVFITQGTSFKVSVKAYENLVPYLETEVVNGTLEVHYKDNTNVKNDNAEVYVTMPSLAGTFISGSAGIAVEGIFSGTQLNASISGSGNIDFANGAYDNVDYQSSGSGNLGAFGLTAKHAAIAISGSGNASITATESLDVHISGSGTVYYKGNPEEVNSEISGSGKLISQ